MKKAVLIVHGFVGSLYDNEYLMNYLEFDHKFDVFAYTLPGHHPCYDYQKVSYQAWIDFTNKKIQELISHGYKSIYLIGHSMGGVLAGITSFNYKEVKKIVFINAAYNYLNLKQNKIDILTNKDYKDCLKNLSEKGKAENSAYNGCDDEKNADVADCALVHFELIAHVDESEQPAGQGAERTDEEDGNSQNNIAATLAQCFGA